MAGNFLDDGPKSCIQPEQVLGEAGYRVLTAFAKSELKDLFYLAGGTGLALQLEHRRSLDLDFFQETQDGRVSLKKVLRELDRLFEGFVEVSLRQSNEIGVEIYGTKVSFIAYPFPLLEPTFDIGVKFPTLSGVRVATSREIALMKAYALGRRSSFRDYVDLYFLLRDGHITLREIIEAAEKKFVIRGQTIFSARLFLEQLVYTKDLDDVEATLKLLFDCQTDVDTVRQFMEDIVRHFLSEDALRLRRGPSL